MSIIGKSRGKGINCRYVSLEFSFAHSGGSMTQNRRNTKSAATTMAFAERRYTVDESHVHARVYNILKARRGVTGGGEGGCKVLSSFASRQILLLSCSKMARVEKKERGKGRKDRGGEVHYIWMHIRWRMDF